jgi:hypothetical protein
MTPEGATVEDCHAERAAGEWPTREEWAARQAKAPPAVARLLDMDRQRREDETRAALKREAEAAAKLDRYRDNFERQLLFVIEAEGGEWMKSHRSPDAEWCGPYPFTAEHYSWLAHYDLRRFGLHPIRIMLNRNRDGEYAPAEYPFEVLNPKGGRSFRTLAEAVAAAAVYSAVPF